MLIRPLYNIYNKLCKQTCSKRTYFTCLFCEWQQKQNKADVITSPWCFLFPPRFACRSLVEIDFLTLKQLFPSLREQNKQLKLTEKVVLASKMILTSEWRVAKCVVRVLKVKYEELLLKYILYWYLCAKILEFIF